MGNPESSVGSGSRRAWSGDSPVVLRASIIVASGVVVFGAGAWASTMSNSIAQLTTNATKTEAKLERMEGLLQDIVREQLIRKASAP